MVPILYESDEILFDSNGLGRLRDCISCIVVEERNGIYECDFEYPVIGAHFDEIIEGRIIGVTHDDSSDIQPFDIVGHTEPLDGKVTFHAVHISYRQTKMVVHKVSVNSLSAAFEEFRTNFFPANPLGLGHVNPFTYWTDKDSTGRIAAFDGVPRSIRSILGGVEGSILDSYGGEYEWDKWIVRLYAARGVQRDLTIRYGVNLTDYHNEVDVSEAFNCCIPFWRGTDYVQWGVETHSGWPTVGTGDRCVALDLTDKFETEPTGPNLIAAAKSYMINNQTFAPVENITVDFVRLQDEAGFDNYDNLMTCKLCDTIIVIFPLYKLSAWFKIVKTTWDVLLDRYESMELGSLSLTLSEALGLSKQK